jgi:hypothetical protein
MSGSDEPVSPALSPLPPTVWEFVCEGLGYRSHPA